jgi:hypothetical protein
MVRIEEIKFELPRVHRTPTKPLMVRTARIVRP